MAIKFYREQSQVSEPVSRTALKTLSAQEVADFKVRLQQSCFPNFNKVRYLTEAAFADYPITQLQAPTLMGGISVIYIDLEVANMLSALNRVISDWNTIIQ